LPFFPGIERHMAFFAEGSWLMDDQDKSPSFQERLSAFADDERKRAKLLPPGPEREIALRKIRQAETASHMNDWANSPGLQPPK
jgi:hypothetical protein